MGQGLVPRVFATPTWVGVPGPRTGLVTTVALMYLWARTIRCPYCDGLIPLRRTGALLPTAPALAQPAAAEVRAQGAAMRLRNREDGKDQSPDGCRWRRDLPVSGLRASHGRRRNEASGAGRRYGRAAISRSSSSGASRRRPKPASLAGSGNVATARRDRGRQLAEIAARLAEKMPEWEALDFVPSESIPDGKQDDRAAAIWNDVWRDMFSPRQLLGHATASRSFASCLSEPKSW